MKTQEGLRHRCRQLFTFKTLRRARAVLLTSQPDVFYFTNFTGDDSWAVITPGKTVIITDGRYTIQARQEAPSARIIVRRNSMIEILAKTLRKSAIKSVWVAGEDISVALMERLTNTVKSVTWRTFPKTLILSLRQTKSPAELSRISKALVVAQTSYLKMIRTLRPGQTEHQVAAELEYRMRLAGAQGSAFDTIVACGKNSAKPHATASSAKITAGKPIVIDFGARCDQYCCDLTRTVWLGKITQRFRDIYAVCLEAQLEAIVAIKPGVQASSIDKLARKVIGRAGYGKYFVHGLGHSFGLEVHEQPGLGRRSDVVLQPGMVLTVEPGIYIPGTGGVRIEDDILVTARGHKVLSNLPKQIEQVIL